MKIALASDLHLEFGDIILKNEENADVLVLSGDILIARDLKDHPELPPGSLTLNISNLSRRQEIAQRFRDFLKRCSFQFPHVIYVAGNHEFYHGRFFDTIKILEDECSKFPNVYYLEDKHKDIDDVRFIGCTLWTDMNKRDALTTHTAQQRMNDYHCVKYDFQQFTKLRPIHTIWKHEGSLEYIANNSHGHEKVVVVGHMAPSTVSIHPMYVHDTYMNGAYASDLSEFILDRPQIKLWTHGHTHHNFDYVIGETRIVCNPRGYHGHEQQAVDFKLQYLDI